MYNIEKVELSEVINLLGQPTRHYGKHYYFQCPDCIDKSQNNLIYTESNGLLKSFCCDSSKRLYGEIIKARKGFKSSYIPRPRNTVKIKPEISPQRRLKLDAYQNQTNKDLLSNTEALKYLFKARGITKDTVSLCGIGLDKSKNKWCLPVYSDEGIIGFEFRAYDFSQKKIWKENGTYSCLANINKKTPQTEILIILEGFWDSYCFYQHLKEQKQSEHYHILTPSNGVGSVLNCLSDANLEQYKKVVLYLDSDAKGIQAMNEAKAKYSFIEALTMSCGCKDFNEHYLRCLKS